MSDQKPSVWRTISETNSGVFVWEVWEWMFSFDRRNLPHTFYLMPTRDGGLIHIRCSHYWTNTQALSSIPDYDEHEYQTIISV